MADQLLTDEGSSHGVVGATRPGRHEPEWDMEWALPVEPLFRHCGETGLGGPGRGYAGVLTLSGRDHC